MAKSTDTLKAVTIIGKTVNNPKCFGQYGTITNMQSNGGTGTGYTYYV